jgi:Fe-Mn family superoxide dismutase
MTNTFRQLIEKVQAETDIHQIKFPVYPISKIDQVLSKDSIDLHYGTLYKNYVKKARDTGDRFQIAGAKLHTTFFEQFKEYDSVNNPIGEIKLLINDKFLNFGNFKEQFIEIAMKIHGSGWTYLSTAGKIKTIPNHEIIDDVLILIDCWEHSWLIDYQSDKEKYLKNIWKIIDWDVINDRFAS